LGRSREPAFTVDEVRRLLAVACAPAGGRTLEERVAETFEALTSLVPHATSFVHWWPEGWQRGQPRFLRSTIPEECARDYVLHYHSVDPMAPSITVRPREVVCLSDFVTDRQLGRLEFSDLLGRHGIGRIVGLTIPTPGAGHLLLSMHREADRHQFTAKERLTIELLGGALERLIVTSERRQDPLSPFDLTARQRRVLELAAHGFGNREIAFTMGVKESTIHTHLKRLFRRLGVSSRTQLAALIHRPL
jgi:DNA-binding CsgD family transcriptional regulator